MIIGPSYGSNCGNLVAECAGDAVCHATAEGPACDVDAMFINTVILFQKIQHISRKLYVVGITCWALGTQAGIPRRWGIDTLRKNYDEASLVCLRSHICILSHVLRCEAVRVVV